MFVPIIYDIILLLIVIVCIIIGFKKGILHTVLSLVCFALAFGAATLISSQEIGEKLYEEYISDSLNAVIDEAVQNAKERAVEQLQNTISQDIEDQAMEKFGFSEEQAGLAGDAVEWLFDNAEQYLQSDSTIFSEIDVSALLTNEEINDKIKEVIRSYSGEVTDMVNEELPSQLQVTQESVESVICTDDAVKALLYEVIGQYTDSDTEGETVSEYLERTVVAPLVIKAARTVLFAASFLIISLILKIISTVILCVLKISPIKAADSALGAALGAVRGILIAVIAVSAVYIVIALTGGNEWLSEDIISKTIIFVRVYEPVQSLILSLVA